jgi:hypothetical protein
MTRVQRSKTLDEEAANAGLLRYHRCPGLFFLLPRGFCVWRVWQGYQSCALSCRGKDVRGFRRLTIGKLNFHQIGRRPRMR